MRHVYTTREEWLAAARDQITEVFEAEGHNVPPTRIGVGFPGGGLRSNTIGECWTREVSGDKTAEIIIRIEVTNGPDILAILIHEMAHAVNGKGLGHGPEFGKLVRPFGLVGPLTSTVPDSELSTTLAIMVLGLGAYPQGSFLAGLGGLLPGGKGPDGKPPIIKSSGPKTQTTRYVKTECPSCGYTARITRKWLAMGNPSCPEGDEMETV